MHVNLELYIPYKLCEINYIRQMGNSLRTRMTGHRFNVVHT